MTDDWTTDVGYTHTRATSDEPCPLDCPHPDHWTRPKETTDA